MKINVDAGHGSNTAGKRTPPLPQNIDINGDGKIDIKAGEQYREHYANVGVAKYLVKELERCKIQTFKTGWNDENAADDPDTGLTTRQSAIASAGCDYSISIHFDAYGDGESFNSGEGIGVIIHDKYAGQSEKMAQIVLKHLVNGTKQKNRGVSKQSLAMCNCNAMDTKGAILCELAFMTNLKEATQMMTSEKFWKECAQEICQGVCEYIGVKYIKEGEVIMPSSSISVTSSKEDIIWLQSKLNECLSKNESFIPLAVDGDYGPKTRIAVLIYWERLGWGKHMKDDGKKAGKATIEALASGKKAY